MEPRVSTRGLMQLSLPLYVQASFFLEYKLTLAQETDLSNNAAAPLFATDESIKTSLKRSFPSLITNSVTIHAIASASAELASCVVLAPAEVAKQNANVLRQPTSIRFARLSSLQTVYYLLQNRRDLTMMM